MARRNHRIARAAGGLAAVALVMVAGCSFTGGTENSARPRPPCVAPGVTDDEVRIGFVYPDSGVLAKPLSTVRAGFEARIEQANADGGVRGRRIVTTWRDDKSEADKNGQAVRELNEKENVFGLVEATTVASGGADYLRDRNIPVAGLPAEEVWSKYNNMFAYAYLISGGSSVDTFGRYVRAQGGTRAAVIKTDIAQTSRDMATGLEASLTAAGVEVLPGPFLWNLNTITPQTLARQLQQSGADAIVGTVSSDELAEVMQAGRPIGLEPKVVLAANGYDPSQLVRHGAAMAGLSTFVNYIPFEVRNPAQRIYLNAMSSYAPQIARPDQELALVTYILTDVFLHGLELAGECPTRDAFVRNLRRSSGYNARGLLAGAVDFTRDFGLMSTCYSFVKVNPSGTGYEIVRNNSPGVQDPTQWCGQRLRT